MLMYDENYTVDWNPSTTMSGKINDKTDGKENIGSNRLDSNIVWGSPSEENTKTKSATQLKYAGIDFNVTQSEAVCHPSHYNTGKIEVIDFIEDQKLGFHLGNAVKYISRAGKKDPAKVKEDLEKAIWYINRYIKMMEDKG